MRVSDQLSYFALTAGIIRAGYRAFPISPRNSDVGVANLLQKMSVKYLFVSKDHAMQKIAASACERIRTSDEPFAVELLPIPTFKILYDGSGSSFEPLPPLDRVDIRSNLMILHSSGNFLSICLLLIV